MGLLALTVLSGAETNWAQGAVSQLTTNLTEETWGIRNSVTSGGQVFWVDGDGSVVYFDGTATNVLQAQGTLGAVDDVVFTLGSGAGAGQTIGVWRRGQDSGWVSADGAPPVPVAAANPIDPEQPMNAEGVAVADGSVFMILQAGTSKHVFQVNPVSGQGTNLTGGAKVAGAEGRLSTSGGQAAWSFLDNTNDIYQLHFYDGTAWRIVDSGIHGNPHLAGGRIVYLKPVNGLSQVFLYDSTLTSPAPVQLTSDSAGTNAFPRTDGRHVAWLHTEPGATNTHIRLLGGVQLTSSGTGLPNEFGGLREHPFQLNRGQVLWVDATGRLQYDTGGGTQTLDLSPGKGFGGTSGGTPCCVPWLTDGVVVWTGLRDDGGTDREVFRLLATPPGDAAQPSPPLRVQATAGSQAVTLTWDSILGATSYTLYAAYDPSVNRSNYGSLAGGIRIPGVTSPFTLGGLTNRIYFFAVSAVVDPLEGPSSQPTLAALWAPAGDAPRTNLHAVAADLTNGPIAYVSGGRAVHRTGDGGATWQALAGGIEGLDVRALAVDGARVYAATRDVFGVGPAQVLRSQDSGDSWTVVVPDGGELGEQHKVIALDPVNPQRLYAADFSLPTMVDEDSFLLYSPDGGTNWTHLPDPTVPLGAEMRAYALAVHPLDPRILFTAGSGTPNLVRSDDAGIQWTNVSPGPGFVYALALDPGQAHTVYAGLVDSTQESRGLVKSTDGGLSWRPSNGGLPTPLPRVNTLLIDPLNPQQIHAATDQGHFLSLDGGAHWSSADAGLDTEGARWVNALALTASRQLLAATAEGLYRLDLSTLNLTPPTLTITPSATTATLAWPAASDGFRPESTDQLGPPISWTELADPIVVTNDQRQVVVDLGPRPRFYRLRKP